MVSWCLAPILVLDVAPLVPGTDSHGQPGPAGAWHRSGARHRL